MCEEHKPVEEFNSLIELVDYFDSEDKCIDYLAAMRWDAEPVCPYCSHEGAYTIQLKNRPKRFKCASCRKQFSVRVGTIFEDSKISLRKWFIAIYLHTSHKKGNLLNSARKRHQSNPKDRLVYALSYSICTRI